MSSTPSNYYPVSDFYSGKSIFITGGTGFLGKVLQEKLIYSCKDVDKLYVLTREKKNCSPEQRLQKIKDDIIFKRIRNVRPQDLDKIIPIAGDLCAPNLGLKAEDEITLIEKVSIVFHSAATVSFNEPLKVALRVNFEGTKKVLALCKRIRNLQAFVHISTAFTNTDRPVIDEVIYPPPASISQVYRHVEQNGDSEEKTVEILNGRPNTYIFTKALTESYIAENNGQLPTIIIRPSIVTPSKNEPLSGWLDNWNGATGLLLATAEGWFRAMLGDGRNVADLIPVDYVANMAIVAAARCKGVGNVTVYNCCTSSVNPISWQETVKYFTDEAKKHSFNKLPFPGLLFTRSKYLLAVVALFTQTIPAYFGDFCLFLTGRRTRFVKALNQLNSLRDKLQFFTRHSWQLQAQGARALSAGLSHADRVRFPCDPADIKWRQYLQLYYLAAARYLIKNKL